MTLPLYTPRDAQAALDLLTLCSRREAPCDIPTCPATFAECLPISRPGPNPSRSWTRSGVPLLFRRQSGRFGHAAYAAAAAGVALLVVQRLTRRNLLGGMALFGIFISLASAALP